MTSEKTPLYLTYQEPEDREKIKNLVFLLTAKHIPDEEAARVVNDYKTYLNKNYISLTTFVWSRYCNKT